MSTGPRIPGQRLLHSPGPTRLPDEVLHALARQPMDLADPRLDATIAECEAGLKRLLHTRESDVLMFAARHLRREMIHALGLGAEEMALRFTDPLQAILFLPVRHANRKGLLMPLRMRRD